MNDLHLHFAVSVVGVVWTWVWDFRWIIQVGAASTQHFSRYTIRPHLFKYIPNKVNLTLILPTTTIVAQPFNVIKWQMKFNPVA